MKVINVIDNYAAGRKRVGRERQWILKVPNTTYGRQAIDEMRKLVKPQGSLVLRGRGPRKIYVGLTSDPYNELPQKFSRYFAVYFRPNARERKNPYRKENTAINKIFNLLPERGFQLTTFTDSPLDMQLLDKA